MATSFSVRLTIKFLGEAPDGLRVVSQANTSVECYICSRSALPGALRNADPESVNPLDATGVYLLIGPLSAGGDENRSSAAQLYIGQADSVQERLGAHLKDADKNWWVTCAVLKRSPQSLNLTECRYLESALCNLAFRAGMCTLANHNAPGQPNTSPDDQAEAEDFLKNALTILNALGWRYFEPTPKPEPSGAYEPPEPEVPPKLRPILDELREVMTGPGFPRSKWYWTGAPDFRARFALDSNPEDVRVFARIACAKQKGWFRVRLTMTDMDHMAKIKVKSSADINDAFRAKVRQAYENAERRR